MNLFKVYKKKISLFLNVLKKDNLIEYPENIKKITVELPPKETEADISCNAAMILSKSNNMSPLDLGLILKKKLLNYFNEFEKIEVSKQGFLNIKFGIIFWEKFLLNVIENKISYGSNNENVKKYNLEFVSANPTGPLHVGHCRGAVLGDALANLLKFNGNAVTKEYYVNDSGGQVKIFINSVYYRILEIVKKKKFPLDKDLYPGDYIISIAKEIIKNKIIKDYSNFDKISNILTEEALKISMNLIQDNLKMLGITHDNFVYESELILSDAVHKTIKNLEKDNYVYKGRLEAPKGELNKDWKARDQLIFNSTKFGDDTDRALQKNDGSWTYFASDIAYHGNKINRNFDILINILGADHSGYIKRIAAATKAISKNKTNLICKVSQLVKLFKNGKPFKMSKRKGDYITVEDLINEVGKDSVRFMMLSRSNDVELDFDFKKVSEKSKENPVFYVQYAYARINSIFRSINIKIDDKINTENAKFILNKYEIEILKKISEWPRCVDLASTKLEPHRISFYLYDLVSLFHSYWSLGNENKEYRFTSDNGELNKTRLMLLQSLAIVIKNGLSILGVSTPSTM